MPKKVTEHHNRRNDDIYSDYIKLSEKKNKRGIPIHKRAWIIDELCQKFYLSKHTIEAALFEKRHRIIKQLNQLDLFKEVN